MTKALIIALLLVSQPLLANNCPNFRTLIFNQQQLRDFDQVVSRGLVALGGEDVVSTSNSHGLFGHKWVSVGSGNGLIENALAQDGVSVTTVEPFPNAFNGLAAITVPDFDYVDTFVAQSHFDFVQNFVLFLNWAEPTLNYDYEAVEKLQPKYILSIYEISGGAGGDQFRDFVEKSKRGLTNYRILSQKIINHLVTTYSEVDHPDDEPIDLDVSLVVLERKDKAKRQTQHMFPGPDANQIKMETIGQHLVNCCSVVSSFVLPLISAIPLIPFLVHASLKQ